jgi:hypothetical protein
MDELLLIALILTAVWYWWNTQQCNEIALAVCQQKCANAGLQLLDATVTRQRSWLRRGSSGRIQICRLYSFEYSSDLSINHGSADFGQREYGYVVLIGKQVVETKIPHQDDTVTKTIH